eukprot:jgi/Botrbrau1/14038/Bobra.0011s0004.1
MFPYTSYTSILPAKTIYTVYEKNWKYLRTSHALLTTIRNWLRRLRTLLED